MHFQDRSDETIDALTPGRLRAVAAVASTGSFSAAARVVGTSQSNVSRAVAAVEAAIDAQIFDRSTRSVRLTQGGREFVERAMLVGAELDAAVRAMRPESRATPRLVVAGLTSVTELHLPPAVAGLGDRVRRFRCIEGLQATVDHAVASGQASVGIGDLGHVGEELVAHPLWTEPFRLAVPQRHRLARRRRAGIDEIAAEPLVGFSRDAELRTTLDRELASARRLRTPDFVVDRYRTALSMVAAGMGVMVVPAIVRDAVPPGAKLVDLDHPDLHRSIGLIRRPDTTVPDVLDTLFDAIVASVSAIPGVSTGV